MGAKLENEISLMGVTNSILNDLASLCLFVSALCCNSFYNEKKESGMPFAFSIRLSKPGIQTLSKH